MKFTETSLLRQFVFGWQLMCTSVPAQSRQLKVNVKSDLWQRSPLKVVCRIAHTSRQSPGQSHQECICSSNPVNIHLSSPPVQLRGNVPGGVCTPFVTLFSRFIYYWMPLTLFLKPVNSFLFVFFKSSSHVHNGKIHFSTGDWIRTLMFLIRALALYYNEKMW